MIRNLWFTKLKVAAVCKSDCAICSCVTRIPSNWLSIPSNRLSIPSNRSVNINRVVRIRVYCTSQSYNLTSKMYNERMSEPLVISPLQGCMWKFGQKKSEKWVVMVLTKANVNLFWQTFCLPNLYTFKSNLHSEAKGINIFFLKKVRTSFSARISKVSMGTVLRQNSKVLQIS